MKLRPLFILAILCSLAACTPSLESARYFRQTITVKTGDSRLVLTHFFSCRSESDLSEGDMKMHHRWIRSGADSVTSSLGGDKILIYRVTGDCETEHVVNDDPQNVPGMLGLTPYGDETFKVLDRSASPSILFELSYHANDNRKPSAEFPVRIVKETIDRVDRPGGQLGASVQERALKESIRTSEHGFREILVRVFSPEVWDTSSDAHAYFGRFSTVTIAQVGDAPPISGSPDMWVGFPFARERNYSHHKMSDFERASVMLDGNKLIYSASAPIRPYAWLGADKATANISNFCRVTIYFNGIPVEVTGSREVYDPATRNIVQFLNECIVAPWNPEAADRRK